MLLKNNNLDKCKFGVKLTFFLQNTYFSGYQKGHDMWRPRSTSKCPSGDYLTFYFIKSSFKKTSCNSKSSKKWPSNTAMYTGGSQPIPSKDSSNQMCWGEKKCEVSIIATLISASSLHWLNSHHFLILICFGLSGFVL